MKRMRRLADIELLNDYVLQQQMVWASMGIFVAGVLVGVIAAFALPHEVVSLLWFLVLVLVSVVALPIHELVHAGAFMLLTGFTAHLRFGITDWMLYTMAPGTVLRRHRFCAVLLAPAMLVTTALLAVPWSLGFPLLGWFLAVIHLAGCTGDFAYVGIILREPKATHVEDTERGIALFYDA